MKKITSVLLALLLMVGVLAFTACEDNPEEILADATKVLEEQPYVMTMKMNFSSDNEEVNEFFQMMNMEFPVTVDGENLSMDMSMDLLGESMTTKVSLVDKVLYYDIQMGEYSQKMKTTLSGEELAEFMKEQSFEMPVDYSQFGELKVEEKGGKTVITCTGITEEGKKALNEVMGSALDEMDGDAKLGDLSYTITLDDGKYEAMDLSCTYTVTAEGESVTVTMTMGADISYENVSAVKAPADADAYKSVDYDEIFG